MLKKKNTLHRKIHCYINLTFQRNFQSLKSDATRSKLSAIIRLKMTELWDMSLTQYVPQVLIYISQHIEGQRKLTQIMRGELR